MTRGWAAYQRAVPIFAVVVLWLLAAATILTTHAIALEPHSPYASSTNSCAACHDVHGSTVQRKLLGSDGGTALTETDVCFTCHGNAGGSDWNVQTGPNSFGLTTGSGHSVQLLTTDPATDLTSYCSSCHGPHGDPDSDFDLPKKEIDVAGASVSPTSRVEWCTACHNTTHSWYVSTGGTEGDYETKIGSPDRAASTDPDFATGHTYYPTLGTFPGSDHYTNNDGDATQTAHSAIPAGTVMSLVDTSQEATRVAGDCLWCHASHRSDEPYDALLAEFRPSTDDDAPGGLSSANVGDYAQACFECHGRSSIDRTPSDTTDDVYVSSTATPYDNDYWLNTASAPDIYSLASDSANPTRTGHQIRSLGAYYPVGSPLPCYECHNPHGSKNGNTTMISDALGRDLDPRGTGPEVRAFCFSCHTTGDTTAGWSSVLNDYENVAAGTKVVGIDRTYSPTDSTPGWLQLSNKSYHREADATSCLACHDSAHNPGAGVSKGGKDCYLCHGTYQQYMEDGVDVDSSDGENVVGGDARSSYYHHVMGSSSFDGDEAVGGTDSGNFTNYPQAGTDVYCVSCHVDHDKFNSSKSSSLRSTIAGTDTAPGSVTAASSDFNATDGGVCLGCHYLSRTKDTANQKSDGTSVTPVIPDTTANTLAAATTAYDNSPHQYGVTGRARSDNTTFSGDCSKCHSDGQTGLTATTGAEFGLHYDASRRILEALGRGTVSDPYAEERFCYSCHSPLSAGLKTTATGADWYGTTGIMGSGSEDVYTQFTGAGYSAKHSLTLSDSAHKPTSTDEVADYRLSTAEHVECTDCHSPHAAGSVTVTNRVATTPVTSDGNRIGSTSPLNGVWGVEPPEMLAWDDDESSLTGYVIRPVADYEYQICFKCHSGFNSSYSSETRTFSWDSATGWTNQAFEFNTNNASYHPVMGSLGTRALSDTAMKAPWNVNVGSQTMYCTDCHMDSAAGPPAQGPHGSANQWILRGTWDPATDTIDPAAGSSTFLCAKCHTIAGTNAAHNANGHTDQPCGGCHIAVPHGGKIPRLLATRSIGGLDARYDSEVTGLSSVTLPLVKPQPQNSCQTGISGCNPTFHNSAAQTYSW